jgi:hypothetical protein
MAFEKMWPKYANTTGIAATAMAVVISLNVRM